MATGRPRWFPPTHRGGDLLAGLSPDGQTIASDWYWNTTVLDPAGAVAWQCLYAVIPAATNAAWTGTRHLPVSMDDEDGQLLIVDVRDDTRHAVGPALPIPTGVVGDRRITRPRYDLGHPPHWALISTALDDTDPQPLITTTPGSTPAGIVTCDLARRAPITTG